MKIRETVSGKTNVFGIIGNPVDHSFSPIMQTTLAKEHGLDAVYVPFKVENADVATAIKGAYALGIKGLNITVPHKKTVIESLVSIDDDAKKIGAVNTIRLTKGGYKGFNTDILGLEKSFFINNIEIKDKTVAILGAGGAANSAAMLFAKEGAKKLFIVNRTKEKAIALKEQIEKNYDIDIVVTDYSDLEGIKPLDIVFQSTSVGMGSDESPIKDKSFFNGVGCAFDAVYVPAETKFLKDAKEYGCITINGFDMLVYQGIASFEIWNEMKVSDNDAIAFRDLFLEKYYHSR